jgi:hypothetical protein
LSTREQNEHKFDEWEDLPDGGRRYWMDIPGRNGRNARYLKAVDSNETTLRFWQEIYSAAGVLVEVHVKYPIDEGHRKV